MQPGTVPHLVLVLGLWLSYVGIKGTISFIYRSIFK